MRKSKSYITYDCHIEFLNWVMNLHQQNPQALRLDLTTNRGGKTNNGNIAAAFMYPESAEDQQYTAQWVKWIVHYDARIDELIKAQKLIEQGNKFPFEAVPTERGIGTKLKLIGSGFGPDLHIYKVERKFDQIIFD